MNVYKLRDRTSGMFINKNRSTADRIYQNKRTAASAASMLSGQQWQRISNRDWYQISAEERRAYRESIIEIVEFECEENSREAHLARAVAIIKDFLAIMDDPNVDPSLKEDIRDVWREQLHNAGWPV